LSTIFRALATVSLTVTVTLAYADVRCPACARKLLEVPAATPAIARVVTHAPRTGNGPVCACPRCKALVEVVAR